MNYLHVKFHTPRHNGSLFIEFKPNSNEKFRTVAIVLLYIVTDLLRARTVELEETPLLRNVSINTLLRNQIHHPSLGSGPQAITIHEQSLGNGQEGSDATIEESLRAVFSLLSVPRLYKEAR
jgi:hypothetical protein